MPRRSHSSCNARASLPSTPTVTASSVDGRVALAYAKARRVGLWIFDTSTIAWLRAGSTCGGGVNVLQVVDLANISQPRLAQSYPLSGPQGLGVDGQQLFVCDADGLRVFDTSQTPRLTQRQFFPVKVVDVIPNGGTLLAIGADGLYQYDYRGAQLKQLSFLPVTPQL